MPPPGPYAELSLVLAQRKREKDAGELLVQRSGKRRGAGEERRGAGEENTEQNRAKTEKRI
jgi:hypothetical protein